MNWEDRIGYEVALKWGKMMQGKVDGFVLRNYFVMSTDQMIGTAMLEFELLYDQAEMMVLKALKVTKGRQANDRGSSSTDTARDYNS